MIIGVDEMHAEINAAIRVDEIKRYHAYPLLIDALRGAVAAFAEVTPAQRDFEAIGRAANLLHVLGEK